MTLPVSHHSAVLAGLPNDEEGQGLAQYYDDNWHLPQYVLILA